MTQCHSKKSSPLQSACFATLHCLSGCVIGEFIGLAVGAHFSLSVLLIFIISTACAFLSGFALAILPLMRRARISFKAALKIIWIGEVVSISVMEVAMNTTDYLLGGMQSNGLMDPIFWSSFGVALVCGFLAALPINHILLKKELKRCH